MLHETVRKEGICFMSAGYLTLITKKPKNILQYLITRQTGHAGNMTIPNIVERERETGKNTVVLLKIITVT